MINTELIERLIELSLISGYVKDGEAPLSLILISYPETAKTRMILKFNAKHSIEASDLSAKPISTVIIPLLDKDEIHHIIIPDMVKVLAHRPSTVDATIGFLNNLMEEGIKKNLFFGQMFEFKERKKCGIITALTFDYFYKMFKKWREIGFTSRFLPVSFKYSEDTVLEINSSILDDKIFDDIRNVKKIKKKKVEIPREIGSRIMLLASDIAKEQSKETVVVGVQGGKTKRIPVQIYGFRLHRQMRKLASSIALSNGRTIVNWNDMTELEYLKDFIRLPRNPKVI